MSRRIYGLFLTLEFPAGIAPGEGGDYNLLRLARNGADKPVLRGTALAGALWHTYWQHLREANADDLDDAARLAGVRYYFGEALGEDGDASGEESRLKVRDCVLEVTPFTRTHHLRNRHTGAVADAGLFTLELCPPGTATPVTIWLADDQPEPDDALGFLDILVQRLRSGITFGGNAARGIGLAVLQGDAVYRRYDLDQVDDYAQWLDDHRTCRKDPNAVPAGYRPLQPTGDNPTQALQITLRLGIPRGQDVLIGDGQGKSYEIEPQRVVSADGKPCWRLPGASLRGLFRGWVTRLAAREGKLVADHAERQTCQNGSLPDHEKLNGNNLGWGFVPDAERKARKVPDCPVLGLFGSLYRAGRIHISDAYAACSSAQEDELPAEEQLRMHVAVDRITGGAAESMLFNNTVLTAYPGGKSPVFEVIMRIQKPTPDDARWLAKTLRALDLGILRVGSSKSCGRLALVAAPTVSGPASVIEPFNGLKATNNIEV